MIWKTKSRFTWNIFFYFITAFVHGSHCEPSESALIHRLLDNYHPDARPVPGQVNVSLHFFVGKLHEIIERTQVMKVTGGFTMASQKNNLFLFFKQLWDDNRLAWNTSEYPGIERIALHQRLIWTPDLAIYNSVTNQRHSIQDETFRAIVYPNGRVTLTVSGQLITNCILDVTYFPFDEQACYIDLSCWVYPTHLVKFNSPDHFSVMNYIQPQWKFAKTEVQHLYYAGGNDEFEAWYFILYLQRKPMFYVTTLVIPMVIMSLLTLLMFCLPADSGEKISLGITLLLSFSVFQILLSESMPRTSDQLPLLELYILCILILTSFALVCTVLVLQMHHRDKDRQVPSWLHALTFTVIATLFCQKPEKTIQADEVSSGNQEDNPVCDAPVKHNDSFNIGNESARINKHDGKNTWQEMARIWDSFFFVLGVVLVIILTISIMVIYPLGKPHATPHFL